jgi:hypothetical protein
MRIADVSNKKSHVIINSNYVQKSNDSVFANSGHTADSYFHI